MKAPDQAKTGRSEAEKSCLDVSGSGGKPSDTGNRKLKTWVKRETRINLATARRGKTEVRWGKSRGRGLGSWGRE